MASDNTEFWLPFHAAILSFAVLLLSATGQTATLAAGNLPQFEFTVVIACGLFAAIVGVRGIWRHRSGFAQLAN